MEGREEGMEGRKGGRKEWKEGRKERKGKEERVHSKHDISIARGDSFRMQGRKGGRKEGSPLSFCATHCTKRPTGESHHQSLYISTVLPHQKGLPVAVLQFA